MSKIAKAVERLKSKPTDLKWREIEYILNYFGYKFLEGSGSRLKCYHPEKKQILSIHKPHNPSILKDYQVKEVLARLREDGFI